ncbi:MAG: cyclic nucleotide-binding domain-containing protein [Oscillospiraceae bacterium]|nr:cyclic nucleotide-binding domain-containing protein [Oscillospiraceae bacterium]
MRRRTAAQELLNGLNKYGLPVERLVNPYVLEFDAGEILCLDGEPVEWLFFLLEGRAKIFMTVDTGENLILNLWDGYGVLCDMELFMGDGIYHASCRAITPVRGIALPLDVNREILLGCNEYLRRTCRSFARTMAKDRNVFNNILYPVEARLCSYIAINGTEGEWSDNLTQVSELLGVSYRHLLRTLRGLCAKGVLRRTESGYVVADQRAFASYNKGFVTMEET